MCIVTSFKLSCVIVVALVVCIVVVILFVLLLVLSCLVCNCFWFGRVYCCGYLMCIVVLREHCCFSLYFRCRTAG
jgi:hypothetical protein